MRLAIPPEYRRPVLLLMMSGILLFASLWQIEVIFIGATSGWGEWTAPFYLFKCSWAVARDIWYAGVMIAFLLLWGAASTWTDTRTMLRIRRLNEDALKDAPRLRTTRELLEYLDKE